MGRYQPSGVVVLLVVAIFCRVGAYAPPGSDAACTQCPAGYTTVAMGSSSAASCSGKLLLLLTMKFSLESIPN